MKLSLLVFVCTSSIAAALPAPALTADVDVSSVAESTCGASISTIVKTRANSTEKTSTLQLLHTLSAFTPQPSACNLTTSIGVPAGFKARLGSASIDVRGYLAVPYGSTTVFSTVYSFASKPETPFSSYSKVRGPVSGWFNSHIIKGGDAVWSSCAGDTLVSAYALQGEGETNGEDWVASTEVDVEVC